MSQFEVAKLLGTFMGFSLALIVFTVIIAIISWIILSVILDSIRQVRNYRDSES